VLTCHLDPLQDVFRTYPKAEQIFRDNIRAANLGKGIRASEFQIQKERILILHYLLMNINGLDRDQTQSLADAVLIRRDRRAILDLLKCLVNADKSGASNGLLNSAKENLKTPFGMSDEGSGGSRRILWGSKSTKLMREETLWREANNFASSVSDSDFLTQLKTAVLDECLCDATAKAEEAAYVCLTTAVKSLVSGIGQQILSVRKGECDKQIQREVGNAEEREERELRILRSDFVRQIEDLTRKRSRSYVHHIPRREDSLTQCSRKSIYIDKFVPKKERYYSQGLFDSLVKPLAYLNEPDRDLLNPWETRIPAKPRDRISRSHSNPARRGKPQSPARFLFCPNACPE